MKSNRSIPASTVVPVLAGHEWTFSQSIADVAPEEWGGESGQL
jgi:hypothetical protein